MGRRREGISVRKYEREQRRRERKKLQEQQNKGSSSQPAPSKSLQRALAGKKELQTVRLKRQGGGKFWPRITPEAWGKLRKMKHAQVGRYTYLVDASKGVAGEKIYFDVICDMALGKGHEKYIASYSLGIKNKTIKRQNTSVRERR